ncbi:hypothetical protein, partial [Aeromonas veronii]|uniref:hypothetical protein n=1 Tax=Aeromonas veronii TaxID=654 RepID=UPI003BA3D4EB
MEASNPVPRVANHPKITVITYQKEGIAALPAPSFRQELLLSGFWMFKMPKPGHQTGLCVGSCVKICESLGKNTHSKKAFPIGKAFKLVAERTGLE